MAPETRKPNNRIRSVWAHNLESEFDLIRCCVSSCFGGSSGAHLYVAMDTEFPGVIHHPSKHFALLSPAERYALLRSNVNSLNLIQLGLTLSDGPAGTRHVWEFNFSDFDVRRGDLHARESVALLRASGVDLERTATHGADSRRFAWLLAGSGLVLNPAAVSWVTFHSAYDFGFLIKILTRRNLPRSLEGFMGAVRFYFGERGFVDMKHAMRYCDGLYGGLERVAGALRVERAAGGCHQAGSDSLLTWQAFVRMRESYFGGCGEEEKHAGVLFGLEIF